MSLKPPHQPALSVCIITLNEEANVARCLDSVRDLATQIVVVDSESVDRTGQIVEAAGAELWLQPFLGYERQKQIALDKATSEWVLCLDADEWLDTDLQESIAQALAQPPPPDVDGFLLNRWTWYLGRWIDHSGWSPEWKLRLVRRGRGRWSGGDPHERLEVTGAVRRLRGRLRHYPHRNLSEHLDQINRYTTMIAERGRLAEPWRTTLGVAIEPPLVFLQKYLLQLGFLDGTRGLIVSAMTAFYFLVRYAKQWEKRHLDLSSGSVRG